MPNFGRMYRDDWFLRQIADLVDGLAGVRHEAADQIQLGGLPATFDDVARQLVGLSFDAIDRLPPAALMGVTDGLEPARRKALAELLMIAAPLAEQMGDVELAEARRAKALYLASS